MSELKRYDEKIYESICNDNEIQSIYHKIGEIENLWAHHDLSHVNNVIKFTEQILTDMNCNKELIENAKIAAYMHDIGTLQGKSNHAYRSYEYAKDYFSKKNIHLKYQDQVLEAIKNHSDGFDTDNIIQSSLILADKIDIKSTRPTKLGLQVEGMRQMNYIEDIDLKVENNILNINFVCSDGIDKEELENYYFMKKVGNAIKTFAENFNLKYNVNFNDVEWKEIL